MERLPLEPAAVAVRCRSLIVIRETTFDAIYLNGNRNQSNCTEAETRRMDLDG